MESGFSAGKYRAFLSYSHRDEKAAARLHRRLETWRVPSKLVGSDAGRRPVPARLSPIFRDREELSAGENLSEAVQAGLAASEAMIVLCSPAAKASHWVGREIETFRALYPDRPILAAIIEGEPQDAFPEALTRIAEEPLAADLRKSGDGERLGLLKLAAGLTDLPLDTLVQRDAQRQLRRVTAITVAALVLVLVMALLTLFAINARREAERQRAEAEGLVEYMLTDLRQTLKGVGRPEAMAGVNERAMAFYAAQGDLSALPPESLERRARVLHAIGEDIERFGGDAGKALANFKEAHRTTAATLAQRPDDPDAIFAHAQSEYWVGAAARRRNDLPTTARHWQGYLNQAKALAKVEPGTVRSLMELGYAEGNLCDLGIASKALDTAMEHCRAAITHEQAALAKQPSSKSIRSDLANRHGWMANLLFEKKDYAGALVERAKEESLLASLAKADPGNIDVTMRKAWNDFGTGKALAGLGRYQQALAPLSAALWGVDKVESVSGAAPPSSTLRLRILYSLADAQFRVGNAAWRNSRARGLAAIDRMMDDPELAEGVGGMRAYIQAIGSTGKE